MTCEDRNLDPSLVEMLDDVIMLYHIAVHKQLSKVRVIFFKAIPLYSHLLYCEHLRDRELVSLIARISNSVNLLQLNVCHLFLLGI